MASSTDNFNLRKDGRDDYYDIDVVNDNLDKIDSALQKIKKEAENKNGGNADMLGGKYASDFTGYEVFGSIDELSESVYEGLFYISNSQITGISLKSGQETDVQPDKSVVFDNYTRIYTDTDGRLYIKTDKYYEEESIWEKGTFKSFAFDGHRHIAEDITDFPLKLPADGGNADTVGGRRASDFAEAGHSHGKSDITDFPLSLPANGGNADTVGGKRASDFAEASHSHGKSDITDFPLSLPADGGNADTISGIGIDGIQTKQTGTSSYTDWNEIIEPGFHKLMPHTENEPNSGDWFFPIVFAYDTTGITQLAVAYRYDWIYMRHKKKLDSGITGWTEWRKIGGAFEQTVKTDGTDLNTLHGSTELYNLQGDFINGPDGVGSWGSLLSLYGTGSGKTIQVYFPDAGNGAYIRRCKVNGSSWSEWVNIGGEAVESIRKSTKTFTASAGNWYRLVKGKPHNGSDNSGACGIMTITADSAEYYSGDVISVVQNGSSGSFTILNHSKHNGFFNAYRMVRGNDGYMYIDGYTNLNGGLTSLTFTFSGVGWNICDYIAVIGSNFGSVVMEAAV